MSPNTMRWTWLSSSCCWKTVAVMPDTTMMTAKTTPRAIASWWGFSRDFTEGNVLRGPSGLEVLPVPAGRRSPLALVLRPERPRPVGHVGRRGHPQEADLADLHPRVERDREAGHVRQLEGDGPDR